MVAPRPRARPGEGRLLSSPRAPPLELAASVRCLQVGLSRLEPSTPPDTTFRNTNQHPSGSRRLRSNAQAKKPRQKLPAAAGSRSPLDSAFRASTSSGPNWSSPSLMHQETVILEKDQGRKGSPGTSAVLVRGWALASPRRPLSAAWHASGASLPSLGARLPSACSATCLQPHHAPAHGALARSCTRAAAAPLGDHSCLPPPPLDHGGDCTGATARGPGVDLSVKASSRCALRAQLLNLSEPLSPALPDEHTAGAQ